jgi:hypothetical protein
MLSQRSKVDTAALLGMKICAEADKKDVSAYQRYRTLLKSGRWQSGPRRRAAVVVAHPDDETRLLANNQSSALR